MADTAADMPTDIVGALRTPDGRPLKQALAQA